MRENIFGPIYGELKKRIITNAYMPGEIVSENSLAAEFNVSRTPVREAIKKLQYEKLIVTIPKVGIQVSNIEINELKNSFVVRKELENLVIKTAIPLFKPTDFDELREIASLLITLDESADDEDRMKVIEIDFMFHKKLWDICNNDVLARYLAELNYTEQRWWYYMKKVNPCLTEVGDVGSLLKLIDYMEKGDEENAILVMSKHVEYYITMVRSNFLGQV